jgi:predicted DNA-binding protein
MPKGIVHKKLWKLQTVRMKEEDQKRLDEIAEKVYRTKSRSAAIRLLIEDSWKEMQCLPLVQQ